MKYFKKIISYKKLWIISIVVCFFIYFIVNNFSRDIIASKVAPPLAKSTAKGYVAIKNLDKIIKLNSEKIALMKQSSYERKVSRAYHDLILLGGSEFAQRYNIREKMSKKEVLDRMQHLTKEKIYFLIDEFPNIVITNLILREKDAPKNKVELIDLFKKVKKKASTELEDDHYYLKQ